VSSERLLRLPIASRALGVTRTVLVYLPEAYERSDQAFPSVYLLRGDEREWANPCQDNHREGRSALVVANDLVRAGRMRRNEEPWHSNYLRSRHLPRLLEARGHRNGFGQLVLRGSRHTLVLGGRTPGTQPATPRGAHPRGMKREYHQWEPQSVG